MCKRRRKRGRRAASDNEASLRRAYRRRTRNLDGSRSADRTRAARPPENSWAPFPLMQLTAPRRRLTNATETLWS